MQQYLSNYSPMDGVRVNGSMKDITFDSIELTKNAILALVKVNGQINVTVDGLR
jgi:hypothetical protein